MPVMKPFTIEAAISHTKKEAMHEIPDFFPGRIPLAGQSMIHFSQYLVFYFCIFMYIFCLVIEFKHEWE